MENVIVDRVADFLKQYPPFEYLSSQELYALATKVQVHYTPSRSIIFKVGEATHKVFYIVQQGAVGLRSEALNPSWIDICDEGDILGLRPLFADQTYAMEAVAKEESVLYAIPVQMFKTLLATNTKVMSFLLESFASNTRNPKAEDAKGKLISSNYSISYQQEVATLDFFQQAFYTKMPVCLHPGATIISGAQLMHEYKISSLLITENHRPVGIVTDKDIRRWVAHGELSNQAALVSIMSSPVRCVPPEIHVFDVQTLLLQHKIGHLCVTKDGTNQSEVVGILSEHDVVSAQANNPIALLKQIERNKTPTTLVRTRGSLSKLLEAYLKANLPMSHLMKVSELVTKTLMYRVVELCEDQLGKAPVNYAWLGIGSQGRGEQILLTDQDHALVFEDVPEDLLQSTQHYFLKLANKVSKLFNTLGYVYCPADMMASNPDYCMSLSQWKLQFQKWIEQPSSEHMMMCSIFFDYTKIYGDESLSTQLNTYILHKVENNQRFFAYLGEDAVKTPPPLSFFRQFIIEEDGEHKDEFDLKARAIQPLVDAARVLILSKGLMHISNTIQRFEKMIELEPQNEDVFSGCIKSFHVLSKFRSVEGFRAQSSGRYLELSKLSKSDKIKLKQAFKPIRDVQALLKNRFQLTYFL
jgi:CBS domain-containing protein